jgi:hypothetical protein
VLPTIPDHAATAQPEQNDWAALDKSNKAALELLLANIKPVRTQKKRRD